MATNDLSFKGLIAFVILFALAYAQPALFLHAGAHDHPQVLAFVASDHHALTHHAPERHHKEHDCHECILGKLLQSALVAAPEKPIGSVFKVLAAAQSHQCTMQNADYNPYKARAPPSFLV